MENCQPYAGVDRNEEKGSGGGLFFTTDPNDRASWDNPSLPLQEKIRLPAPGRDRYPAILIDYCRQNPDRVYAWLARADHTFGIYSTTTPRDSWTKMDAIFVSPPDPEQGLYNFGMAVAPNSPGNEDGKNDILFFANKAIWRSVDGGKTWLREYNDIHVDQHTFAFFPEDDSILCYVGSSASHLLSSNANSLLLYNCYVIRFEYYYKQRV